MEAGTIASNGGRSLVERPPLSRLPDRILKYGLTGLSVSVFVLLAFFFIRLYVEAHPVLEKSGLISFVFGNNWDVAHNTFQALPLLVGTLITSALALAIGVPIAVGAAIFLVELCPDSLKSALTVMVDLLAAVPSVVYGLWGFFFLIPKLQPIEQWFTDTFSFIPFFGGAVVAGPNYFIAGLVLSIMILPIVCAISREVLTTVPPDHKEAALALGMTRWEMIRTAMIPYARRGIVGGAMLGLGRALGETIAVVIVIGDAPVIGKTIFDQGYTLAAVIANEFGEAAAQPVHRAALIGSGLVLFVLTLIVNAIARAIVTRSESEGEAPLAAAATGTT